MNADQTKGLSVGSTARENAATLEYGPARRRRRLWPWALFGVALVLASLGYRYRQPVREKVAVLALERRCLNYVRPADFIAYSEVPEDVGDLPARDPQPVGGRYQSLPEAAHFLAQAFFTPAAWEQHPLCKWEPGPAFLHARRTAGGATRLVGVEIGGVGETFQFYPRVIVPAGWTAPARLVPNRFALSMVRDMKDRVRVFAGQPDPNDPSHFTIGYEVNGAPGTVDGWLLEGDTVELYPRAGRNTLDELGDPAWQPVGSKHPGMFDGGPVVPRAKP